MFGTLKIAIAVATTAMLAAPAFSSAAIVTGTTYQYTGDSIGSLLSDEVAHRTASQGTGTLNNGVVGSMDWLNSPAASAAHPYQYEGDPGQLGGVYFHSATITFDLGATYTLDHVTLYLVDDDPSGVSVPRSITVSNGTATVTDNSFDGQASGGLTGVTYSTNVTGEANGYGGAYFSHDVALGGMVGDTITITLADTAWKDGSGNYDNTGGWIGLNEVQFETTPEPASLALLGLGGLAMLRRRRRAYEA